MAMDLRRYLYLHTNKIISPENQLSVYPEINIFAALN